MTHITSPDVPNLYNRHKIGLHREFMKIIEVNELVETGMKNLFTKPNQPDLHKENNKTPFNSEIRESDCYGGKNQILCPFKKDIHSTREPFCPSEGNIQNFNNRAKKNPDGLPMHIGQAQREQIRQQWPRAIAETVYPFYDRDQDKHTQ